MAKLAPSILSCDFSQLREELLAAEEGGAEIIHVDVMDGHFVPNFTFGLPILKAVRKILPRVTIDVHLMTDNPRLYIADFVREGADMISFHLEASADYSLIVDEIVEYGGKPGVALAPGTPWQCLSPILDKLYYVHLMTVHPGFGGQKFIPGMEDKIASLRQEKRRRGLSTEIEIDGGVNDQNIEYLASCGASIIAAGSLVFAHQENIAARVRMLSEKIRPY